MGVLVLATAIVPSLGVRPHYLTQAETPGPVFSKLVPQAVSRPPRSSTPSTSP